MKVSLSTSWQKFTIQIDIPSISGKTIDAADNKLRCLFWMDAGTDFNSRSDTLGHQSGTFDFADVQLEAGTRATPFERRPIAVEMPLCQRYYVSDLRTSVDFVASSTVGSSGFNFPVRMRAIPTITHTAIISQNISNTTVMDVSESGGNLQVISTSTTARTYRYTDIKADAEL